MSSHARLVVVLSLGLISSGCLSGSHGSTSTGGPSGDSVQPGQEITLQLPIAPTDGVQAFSFNAAKTSGGEAAFLGGTLNFDLDNSLIEVTLFRVDNQSYQRVMLWPALAPAGTTNAPPAGNATPTDLLAKWGRQDQPIAIQVAASGEFILAFGYRSAAAINVTLSPSNFTVQNWTSFPAGPGFFFVSNDSGPSKLGDFSANVADRVHPARFSGNFVIPVTGAATIFWAGGAAAGGTFQITLIGPVAKTWTVTTPTTSSPLVYDAEIHSVTIPPGNWTLSYDALWLHGFMVISVLSVPQGPALLFVDELCQPGISCHVAPI